MELSEKLRHGFGKYFAGAGGAAGADGFVVSLDVRAARGNVADGAIGQLGDDRVLEGRRFLYGQAQLDEDLAGQRDPGQLVAEGNHLYLDLQRLALAGGDVEHLVRVYALQELGG